MKDIKNIETIYADCDSNGILRIKDEIDIELIISINRTSKMGLKFIKKISKNITQNSTDWTFIFREYYETLRGNIEAYMLFDKINSNNHQCKNAYICLKHPELELDWNFLETVRLKRNAINYRGQLLKYDDWKILQLQFDLHISKLSREIDNKLKKYS